MGRSELYLLLVIKSTVNRQAVVLIDAMSDDTDIK